MSMRKRTSSRAFPRSSSVVKGKRLRTTSLKPVTVLARSAPRRSGVPFKMRVKLHYWYNWNDTTANPGFYDWVIKGNGLYDPDTAIGGDSVYGLDEYAAIYSYYKVYGSTCSVCTWGYDSSNSQSTVIIPTDTSSVFTAANWPSMFGASRASRPSYSGLYDSVKYTYNRAGTTTVCGVKDVDDVGFQAATNADPTHLWYWHIVSQPIVAAAAKAVKMLHIVYDVEFFSPKANLSH